MEAITHTDTTFDSLQTAPRASLNNPASPPSNQQNQRNRFAGGGSVRGGRTTGSEFDGQGDLGPIGLTLGETQTSTIGDTGHAPRIVWQFRSGYPTSLDLHDGNQIDLGVSPTSKLNATAYTLEDLTNARPVNISGQTSENFDREKDSLTILPVLSQESRLRWGPSPWHNLDGGNIQQQHNGYVSV